MATKEEALSYITELARSGSVARTEVLAAYDAGAPHQAPDPLTAKASIPEILSYIGGGIVFIGIGILVAQHWTTLATATKLLATLGLGIAAYVSGTLLSRKTATERPGAALHLVGALAMPLGLYVLLDSWGVDFGLAGIQSLIASVLFAVYLGSFFLSRKTVLLLFAILYATWAYIAYTSYMVLQNPLGPTLHIMEYRILAAGLAYVFLGYYLSKSSFKALSGFLYGFGIIAVLGATFSLTGFKPSQNMFWELAYPFIAFGTLFLSVRTHANSFLVFGTIALMGYILKITAEYFSDNLGWPLALMISGLAMIAVGYFAYTLRRRFLKQ